MSDHWTREGHFGDGWAVEWTDFSEGRHICRETALQQMCLESGRLQGRSPGSPNRKGAQDGESPSRSRGMDDRAMTR